MNQKNIVIVGASSGIGAALAKNLIAEHNVYTYGRRQVEHSSKHIFWDAESEDMPDISALPENIDGFVYCPGTIQLKPFNRIKLEDFKKEMQINFMGAVVFIQALLPRLKEKGASIVLFSTVAAKIGMPFHSSISASKSAIEGLGKSLAAEFAPHIRVNIIAPSLTHTPLAEKLLNSPEKIEAAANRHPLKIVGNPEEIASLAEFLLLSNSSFITGQVIHADGGISSLKL